MTQKELGEVLGGMAQTWISRLEDPNYGKMTVATLLRLAEAFDTDLEIKFRSFSGMLESVPRQGPDYFEVPSFEEEFGEPKGATASQVSLVTTDQESLQGESTEPFEAIGEMPADVVERSADSRTRHSGGQPGRSGRSGRGGRQKPES